ncbi:hypothetical protein LIER_19483 [Lithospermum erythrorhizon]|uniref:Uncharacterized protein n=1 Tax=Lithospermum erythrorhizon TaxID=34254 RepID=A0AAV3QKK1_LITER
MSILLQSKIMELSTIIDAFDHVVKKQKLSHSKSLQVIDQVSHEIEQALASVQPDQDPAVPIEQKSVLMGLKSKLGDPLNQLHGVQKDLNVNISKFQKALDKTFNNDISKAYRCVDFDTRVINSIITSHLYQEGLFEIGDSLMKESEGSQALSLRLHFFEMHQILEAIKSKDLKHALSWASANHDKLKEFGSHIMLKLHRLQFMEIVKNGSVKEALSYSRTHLAPLAAHHMEEIQKLMGCLLWVGKPDRSPYADLTCPSHWDKLSEELNQMFCNMVGQSTRSPLSVALAAGVEGLPTMLKLANVMAAKKQEWQDMKHLPVPIDLSKEFQFHSVFVCPVSKDRTSEENPPMLLPCGHVLCKKSIYTLSRSNTRSFKCPYCPLDASVSQCRPLHF